MMAMEGWPHGVFLAMEWIWTLGGLLCLAAALLVIARRNSLDEIEDSLKRLHDHPVGKRIPFAVLGIGIPIVLCINKIAQYPTFFLGWDTGIMGNAAWNLIHGHGWTPGPLSNTSYFSVHFAFTIALLSPLLWVWPNIMSLVLAQAAAVGSSVLGVYLLGRLLCRRAWAGWCLAILALSQPSFQGIAAAVLDNSIFAVPFFIWGIYCWESGRNGAALILGLLFLTTREQAPFLFLGLGLLMAARAKDSRQRLLGGGVAACSVLLWLAEIMVIQHARKGQPHLDQSYWGLYRTLGGSPEGVWHTLIRQPWKFIIALFYPYLKIWIPLRTMLSLAFLPLAAGIYLLPALVIWLPQQLSDRTLYLLTGHYASMVFGPLLWAAAIGLRRVLEDTRPRTHSLVMALLLAVSSGCFFSSSRFLPNLDDWILLPWRRSAPAALENVPPHAKVWCDDMLVSNLAMRRYIKSLPHDPDHVFYFENGLFMPDRVIVSRRWLGLAERPTRDRIMKFLASRKFVRIFGDDSFIVLANAAAKGDGSEPVELVNLP